MTVEQAVERNCPPLPVTITITYTPIRAQINWTYSGQVGSIAGQPETCIITDNNIITTRCNSGPVVQVTKPNCESYKRNVYYSGAVEWNSLDADIRKLEHYYQFKRIQKSFLIKTYSD